METLFRLFYSVKILVINQQPRDEETSAYKANYTTRAKIETEWTLFVWHGEVTARERNTTKL